MLQHLLRDDYDGARQGGRAAAGHLRARHPSSSSCRTTASPSSTAPTRSCSRSPSSSRRRCSPPTTATTCSASDAGAHDALLCVQTGSQMSDPDRFKFHGDEHYLKSAQEMRHLFDELPEACDNTLWIAERADVEIEFGKPQLPTFPLPEGFATDTEYLRHLTMEGARQRWGSGLTDAIVERLAYELQRHRQHGLLVVLPHRVGPHQARPRQRHPRRPGPRERGRLRGGLLALDHRPRPDQVRPALRALPQPEPHLDARHRHGLRLPLPGRDDPLRGRDVRARPRRPDRHLLHHQGAGRRCATPPGCSATRTSSATRWPRPCRRWSWAATRRSTPASRSTRSTRTATRWPPTCGRCATRTPTPPRSSTWPRASRACAARTASTPPRW